MSILELVPVCLCNDRLQVIESNLSPPRHGYMYEHIDIRFEHAQWGVCITCCCELVFHMYSLCLYFYGSFMLHVFLVWQKGFDYCCMTRILLLYGGILNIIVYWIYLCCFKSNPHRRKGKFHAMDVPFQDIFSEFWWR